MPIYEYQCTSCGHNFEEWQKNFEEKEVHCPKCGNSAKRLISNTSFILKGTGWYVTDYGRPRNGSNGKSKTTTSSTTETKEATKNSSTQDSK